MNKMTWFATKVSEGGLSISNHIFDTDEVSKLVIIGTGEVIFIGGRVK